jgi:hypothetical protein
VGGGLLLDRCVDTAAIGFSLDYDPPAFFQATALADATQQGGEAVITMKADAGFLRCAIEQSESSLVGCMEAVWWH